ncbi:membrane protein [Caballeronia sordidicola]|uniref:Membrane protein n=1 Tax=Caballeronia sordidicola TaxID=196367 RepID=A0A158EYE7_CABSO|nr:FUSC family protein [Caballeronia sordidicola]SAL12445.1 membrane protein [Caballeronia sordidicola]
MSSTEPPRAVRSHTRRMLHVLGSPYFRYRHAKYLHAARVALALLASIALTSGIDIPHGEWSTVTLLVVIGGLQHHGNIRKKAAERAVGTMLGASLGLGLILLQSVTHSTMITFMLLAVITGVCAYHAIGKPGYIALLTGITTVIVAGHGNLPLDVGLWRTLTVMIGIAIALAFSFVLPQYATYSWRYRLADNMRDSARIYGAIVEGRHIPVDAMSQQFATMNARLVSSRSLLASVAKEIDAPVAVLEDIQRQHRSIITALEMMASAVPDNAPGLAASGHAEERAVRHTLLLMARALRFGRVGLLHAATGSPAAAARLERTASVAAEIAPELQGPYWLAKRLAEQVDRLRLRLIEIERQWNLEGAQPFHR